jgi:hypothetical protein
MRSSENSSGLRNRSPIVESLERTDLLEKHMLYTVISILLLFWIVGLVVHIGGGLIHALLVVALCLFVFNMVTGRRAGV